MRLEVQHLDVKTGKPIVILSEKDAKKKSVFLGDRVKISDGGGDVIAVVDLSSKLKEGRIVLFEETKEELEVEDGDTVELEVTVKPDSIDHIEKKISGKDLKKEEVDGLIGDTVSHRLTDPELMAFIVAMQMSSFSFQEAKYLTRAMIETGQNIDFRKALNKHCIGGVPGNRTTPIIVPILAAAGCTIPKTSSRAITSPAGTADVMEVLCNVDFPSDEIVEIVEETNGCMVWGGALDLVPADDDFIRVRESLSLDPLESVISSVLAKKRSVGSDYVLIDIPLGKEAKVKDRIKANDLSKYFKKLGRELGMEVYTIISDGSQPIGNGIGPALEARDVLRILESRGEEGPDDLKEKSVKLADILLEKAGSNESAVQILESGKAYEKIVEIIKAQGGKTTEPDEIKPGEYSETVTADRGGRVGEISNHLISAITRTADSPQCKGSGLYLHKKVDDSVEEGDELFTVYSENEKRLERAVEIANKNNPYEIKPFLFQTK